MWDSAPSILNRTDVLMYKLDGEAANWSLFFDWLMNARNVRRKFSRLLKSNDPIERTYHYANFKYIDMLPIKCIDICLTDWVIMLTFMLKYYLCCWIIMENIGYLKVVRSESLALPVCCWLCSVCSASIG